MSSLDDFGRWFIEPITKLKDERDYGTAVALIAFPLLDRYLQGKTGEETSRKSPKFLAALVDVIPELSDPTTASIFWDAYRNGLLHNVSIKTDTHGLTNDTAIFELRDGLLWLNPKLFAERVLEHIVRDFAAYEAGSAYPLLSVKVMGAVPTTMQANGFAGAEYRTTIALGTSAK